MVTTPIIIHSNHVEGDHAQHPQGSTIRREGGGEEEEEVEVIMMTSPLR